MNPIKKTLLKEASEFQLLSRLKLMGFMLLALTALTFSYGFCSTIIASSYDNGFDTPFEILTASTFEEEIIEYPPFHLDRKAKIQLYIISGIFAFLGSACLIIVRSKKKRMLG